jgi:hypothetical protein
MNNYNIDCVTLHTVAMGSAVTIGLNQTGGITPENTTTEDTWGNIFAEQSAIVGQKIKIELGSESIAACLAAIPLTGLCLTADGTHEGLTKYTYNKPSCANATQSHIGYKVAAGLVTLQSIEASAGQTATLTASVDAISAGTNPPLAGAYDATIPYALREKFTLGACKIAGQVIDASEIMSASISYNIEVKVADSVGSIWPTDVAVLKVVPSITITTSSLKLLDDAKIPLTGKLALHADTIVQLIGLEAGKSFASFTANKHIRFTMAGQCMISQIESGDGTNQITITGQYDGSNAPLSVVPYTTYSESL